MIYQYSDLMKWFCLMILLILLDIKNYSVGKCINKDKRENLPSTHDEWYHLKHNITKRSTREAISSLESAIVTALYQQEIDEENKRLLDSLKNILKVAEEIDISYNHQLLHQLFSYKRNSATATKKYIDSTFEDNKLLRRLLLIDEWSSGLAQYKLNSNPNNVYSIAIKHYSRIQKNKNYCGESSIQNKIYQLYESLLASVSKGFTMIYMAYEFQQRRPGNTDNRRPAQVIVLNQYKEVVVHMTASASSYLKKINETIYKKSQNCDTDEWAEGVNYIRLKNHVSYYEPNTKWDWDQNAEYLKDMKPEKECDGTQTFWNPSMPDGVIYSLNCPFIFVSDYSGDSSCQRFPKNDFTKAKNIDWESACTTGDNSRLEQLCACDKQFDQDTSIRTISLREHYTDSADSRVVTGIRFIVKNNIVMIQIREGKLVNGIIDPQTVKWIDDDGQHPEVGPDTVKLSYNIRAFELDDIELPDEHLVTGVKLILTNEKRISLAVRGSAMYNDKKKTFPSIHDQWYYSTPNPYKPRSNIDIKYFKNPVDSNDLNHEMSTPGLDYINFSSSVYSSKDENVAIIPFIDSRELVTNPPIALGGLGIFYNSKPGYGGFIAFKYITSEYNILLDRDHDQAINTTLSNILKHLE
ncbi:uncharacterized protein LOC103580700 isoform X2 [Microplitis demolitor]|uniref:uncharacterized protein LOC103580700 isoform X2 n=1 Tax=Microplitis demolitor TaxID=69319 RepID=UPI0004CD4FB7|nr:uncharacterized protein LOC103580700 isoform X2 [Microplitis demolitor]